MISKCNAIHNELLEYTRQGSPSLDWTVQEIARITKHYPRGMTRNILLTELEARWRLSMRRGEHSGKLRQAIQTMTMNSTDIYSGALIKVDEYRYRLRSYDGDDTSVLLLLHRRFADFIAYVNHISTGYPDFFATKSAACLGSGLGRKFSCTKTRLLRSNATAIILPTEYAAFEIDANSKDDIRMLQGPLKELHRQFLQQPSISDDQLQGCYGIVHEVSEIRTYPTARARTYRLVSLQLVTIEGIDQLLLAKDLSTSSSALSLSAGIVFILLFDDQVHMSDLWSPQDLLYIHRPCISVNDQEPLFGMNVEVHTSMGGHVVYPVATPIKKHPRREVNAVYSPTTSGKQMNAYHLIIGAITCVSLIIKKKEGNNDSSGSAEINEIDEQQAAISLSKSLSPDSMVSVKGFFPAQKISISLRVLCKEYVNIRVTTHSTKLKCKRRCVLWCVLSSTISNTGLMLFRLNCAADQAASIDIGHIVIVINARVVTAFESNEIPSKVVPESINVVSNNSCADSANAKRGRIRSPMILITVGKPYVQEIQPFMNSIAKENLTLLEKDSIDSVHLGEVITEEEPCSKKFTNALEITSSSPFQEIAGLTSAESCSILNMSKIASFCNSPSIYPISTVESHGDIGYCGCVTGKVECFGDVRYLRSGLVRRSMSTVKNSDDIDEVGRKRKSISEENSIYMQSESQSVIGVVFLKDRCVSRLCLVGVNTLNMATSRIVIDEDTFFIEESQMDNSKLSFFVSRIDDVITVFENDNNNNDRLGQTVAPDKGCSTCDSSSSRICKVPGRSNGVDDTWHEQLLYDLFEPQQHSGKDCEGNQGDNHHNRHKRSCVRLPSVQEMVEIIRTGGGYKGPIYIAESIDICIHEDN